MNSSEFSVLQHDRGSATSTEISKLREFMSRLIELYSFFGKAKNNSKYFFVNGNYLFSDRMLSWKYAPGEIHASYK